MTNEHQHKRGASKKKDDRTQTKMMTYGKFSGQNQSTEEDFKISEHKDNQKG